MRFTSLVILVSSAVFMSSCSTTTSTSDYTTYVDQLETISKKHKSNTAITNFKKIPKFHNSRDKMAPGFQFYLNHPSDDKIKGRFRADFTGILRLPYNVRINVRGLTFNELKKKVLSSYAKFFQQGVDNVDFKLLYRHYYVEVRGYVKKSGRYLVTRKEGLDKVIDKAGGLKGDLKQNFYKASIKQIKTSYSISLNQYLQNNTYTNSFVWTGGDSIFISEQDESEMGADLPIVTVLGGVIKPGKILFKDKAPIFYYLSKSGGTVPSLAYKESYVIRNNGKKISKIKFDLTDMAAIPAIMPNDIIMLQADKRTGTDKIFERTSQFSSILLTVLLILTL